MDVYLVPGKEESIYLVQSLLEDRLGRSCAYVQGSFLTYGKEVGWLLR